MVGRCSNIKAEVAAGKPVRQAVAIAFSEKDRAKEAEEEMSYADALADLLRSLDGRMTFTMTDPERYKRAHARREAEGFMPPIPGSAGDFREMQALRRQQRLTAAKTEAASAMALVRVGDSDWAERNAEAAADAIENLVRVVMEESK